MPCLGGPASPAPPSWGSHVHRGAVRHPSAAQGSAAAPSSGTSSAATTLVVAADLGSRRPRTPPSRRRRRSPSSTTSRTCRPTPRGRPRQLITITINEDGTASFALPRTEVGQGITTSTAMIIAEELDLPLEKVHVTLAPARPELLSTSSPAAPTPRSRRTPRSGSPPRSPRARCSRPPRSSSARRRAARVQGRRDHRARRRSVTYAELAPPRPARPRSRCEVELKRRAALQVIGKPRNRVDARGIVTGEKKFAIDLDVPDALPTMVCRPPTLNGVAAGAAQPRGGPGDAGRHRRRRSSTPASPSARRRSGSASTRSARCSVDWNPGPWRASPTQTILASCARPSCRWSSPRSRCSPKTVEERLRRSCSAAARRSSPTAAIADVRADRADDLGRAEGRRSSPSRTSPRRSGPAAEAGDGQRDHRRRVVRPQAVRRPRHRGREDLEGDGQAGAS